MSRRDDRALLEDILEASRSAISAVQDKQIADLARDPIWALGLVKCLEIVGEAAARLRPEFRERSGEIPWPVIIGMRNRLVHAYFDIDHEQVWRTLTEDLPALVAQLEQLQAGHPDDD